MRAALSGAFGEPPDIVLSGVNHGSNTGYVILHSGTVGAVMTASTYGVRGLAASLADGGGSWQWESARAALAQTLPWLLTIDAPLTLNLNIPSVEPHELRGVAAARLARFGAVQATVTEAGAGWVKLAYESVAGDREPGTDEALLDEGYATVTPLTAVCEAPFEDLRGLTLARPRIEAVR